MKAFPKAHVSEQSGMDLRDYFAAKAMQALVHRADFDENDLDKHLIEWQSAIAIHAYNYADIMMEARKK